jgi:soluble lytic murein transglycosylase-like protein
MNAQIFCLTLYLLGDTFGALPEDRVELACEQAEHLIETVEQYDIDPAIFAGLIFYESRWDPNAVSHANACGLTQVLPRYVDETCEELKNPVTSISVGARSLDMWTRMTVRDEDGRRRVPRPGGIHEALACYNVGHACLESDRGRNYADRIMRYARRFQEAAAGIETCQEH